MPPQGKNFVGDLLNDGKIRWVETGQIFNSPSAWATHCKRLVNPAKKSGCGWASVRYRGQKLVQYKTTWLHKYQPSADMVRDPRVSASLSLCRFLVKQTFFSPNTVTHLFETRLNSTSVPRSEMIDCEARMKMERIKTANLLVHHTS